MYAYTHFDVSYVHSTKIKFVKGGQKEHTSLQGVSMIVHLHVQTLYVDRAEDYS